VYPITHANMYKIDFSSRYFAKKNWKLETVLNICTRGRWRWDARWSV